MVQAIADELTRTVDEAARRLRAVDESAAAAKPRPEAWSVKEIVGHLVDSAANNLQRFVRAQQVAELTLPGYDQDAWVRAQDYQGRPWCDLLEVWILSNHHLSHAIRRIPASALAVPCRIGADEPVTLRFLVEDYVVHVRHHLRQIDERLA